MRISALFVILSFFVAACADKNRKPDFFTGTIEYVYTYTCGSLNADSLTRVRPSKGIFRYDINNYQSRFIGTDTFSYYYSGKLNKCLSEAGTTRQYECEDYGVMTDSVLSIKDYATDEKILGYSCRILEMQKTGSWVKYYYATGLTISPATYKKHVAYNWDIYGNKANGGLVLKLEHRFKHFTMYGMALQENTENANFRGLEIDENLFSKICK
jgi:hypothetical protein